LIAGQLLNPLTMRHGMLRIRQAPARASVSSDAQDVFRLLL
jgi:hypothetical protein